MKVNKEWGPVKKYSKFYNPDYHNNPYETYNGMCGLQNRRCENDLSF